MFEPTSWCIFKYLCVDLRKQCIHLPQHCACSRMFWNLPHHTHTNNNKILHNSTALTLSICYELIETDTINETMTAAVAAAMAMTVTAKQIPRHRLVYKHSTHWKYSAWKVENIMKWTEQVKNRVRAKKREKLEKESKAEKEKQLRKRENKSYFVWSVSVCL